MSQHAHSHGPVDEGQLASPPLGDEGEEAPVVCNGAYSFFPLWCPVSVR